MKAHALAAELLKLPNLEVTFSYSDTSYGECVQTVEEVNHSPEEHRRIGLIQMVWEAESIRIS